ncbi:MAG TPA: ComEC/Rec2 family competence protein, partial [Candidatus Limnocylindrales bacterium]|nr:ComEC/Rec2 family competence protein [Candidatus Limnocylindrales bacterium]
MNSFLAHTFRRPTLLAVFCASVLVGIGLARIVSFEVVFVVAAGVLACACLRRQGWTALLALMLFGVFLGGFQGSRYMERLGEYRRVEGQKVTIIATAASDSSYGRRSQVTLDVTGAQVVSHNNLRLVGTIGVSGFGENVIFRGDTVQVSGKLRPGSGSHQAWMSFAQITMVERTTSPIEKVRREFGAGIQSALPEPLASFGMGILIGQNTTLPERVYDDLLAVGLVHIIAVSGYNLTIIVRACWRLLGNRSKFQTTIISVMLIF